ncbi:MAG: T9SS type A sorting domain-containing protein, partial [Bacteroidetes bacterium]|nr:T9SS type A sorting domain-containing protein [Bacteroidota bacterium]
HYNSGIGRVECFWVNPNDSNHIYMGSRSGGLWKTTNGGATWKNTTDQLVASGVNSITASPTNPDSVLINVRNAQNGTSHGIYFSNDGGETWAATAFNPTNLNWGGLGSGNQVNKVIFHPRQSNRVYIGTNTGLYVSNNGLKNWLQVESSFYVTDIEFHPTDDNIVYINNNRRTTNRAEVHYSEDGGFTFETTTITGNDQELFIASSADAPNYVWVASTKGIWVSKDRAKTFDFVKNPDESCRGFAVSDVNFRKLIYGYVDLHYSSNGGTIINKVTNWNNTRPGHNYVHADLRTAECVNGVFYVGTDGYLAKSSNGTHWTRISHGTAIRENYNVGVSQSNWQLHMLGSQDNGTSILNPQGWVEFNGGDGMEALVKPLNDDYMIGSWQYGTRNLTINGGLNRQTLSAPESGEGYWIAPMQYDPNNGNKIYHFMTKVYASNNFGSSWQEINPKSIGGKIMFADIAQSNSAYVAFSQGSTLVISTDSGNTHTGVIGLPGYSITDIAFAPNDHETIVVTYNRFIKDGQKVYITHNAGKTWTNISYNLQDMPINSVVIDHQTPANIYLGAEIGVYVMNMEETEWQLFGKGLPNTSVRDMEIQFASNTLKAATWGRGLWEIPLRNRSNYPRIEYIYNEHTPNDVSPKVGIPQAVRARITGNVEAAFVIYNLNGTLLGDTLTMTKGNDNWWVTNAPIPGAKQLHDIVRFKVLAVNKGDTTISHMLTYQARVGEYCLATGTTATTQDYIVKVELNGFKHESQQEYYSYQNNSFIPLKTNTHYELEVTMNYAFQNDHVAAWIDFDKDLEFEVEELVEMSDLNSNHYSKGRFYVPSGLTIGDTLRMRVRSQYFNAQPNPCGQDAGEVEDFTVVVEQGPTDGIPVVKMPSISISPNPANGQFTVNLQKGVGYGNLKVIAASGQIVYNQKVTSHKMQVELQQPKGIYFIQVESNGKIVSDKVVIE